MNILMSMKHRNTPKSDTAYVMYYGMFCKWTPSWYVSGGNLTIGYLSPTTFYIHILNITYVAHTNRHFILKRASHMPSVNSTI